MEAEWVPTWPEQPGQFTFAEQVGDDGPDSLIYCCPCGCGEHGTLRLRVPVNEGLRPSWEWDGNVQKPTLQPSILRTRGCKWHGYLTKGVWITV